MVDGQSYARWEPEGENQRAGEDSHTNSCSVEMCFFWYDLANLEDSLLDCHSLNIYLLNLPLPNNRDM